MIDGRRVALDTNVLFPPTLRDTLLYAADAELFEPLWSVETLAELRRNLITKAGASPEHADRRIRHMTLSFPTATVHAGSADAPDLPDAGDRHVVAAAMANGAALIVSSNRRHFPAAALAPVGLTVQSPDEFLCYLLKQHREMMMRSIRFHASILRHPPTTIVGLLERLSLHAPNFARLALDSVKPAATEKETP